MITASKCLLLIAFHLLDFDIPSVNYQKGSDFYNMAIVIFYIFLIKKTMLNFSNIQKYSFLFCLVHSH